MGSKFSNFDRKHEICDNDGDDFSNSSDKRLDAKRVNSSEFNFTEFVASCSLRSFASLQSQHSTCSVSRPWSRVSRKQWKQQTLTSPTAVSKTAWPVPFTESLFLPTFRIRDDIDENAFFVECPISTGAFGCVSKVVKKDTGQIYAMKVLSKAQIIANGAVQQVKDEVRIQQACGHYALIVNCPYFWQNRKQLFIVSDYVAGGEMLALLQNRGRLDENIIRIFVSQLACALDFLHNAGVIYRDLKLENILLDQQGRVQLIDFGLAKWLKYGARTQTLCGTLQYIAPEILLRQPYGHSADWWSLGVVMGCMLLGEMPYSCCLDDDENVRPFPEIDCSKEAKTLLLRLLHPDPSLRLRNLITMARLAFFKDFNITAAVDMTVDTQVPDVHIPN